MPSNLILLAEAFAVATRGAAKAALSAIDAVEDSFLGCGEVDLPLPLGVASGFSGDGRGPSGLFAWMPAVSRGPIGDGSTAFSAFGVCFI